MTDMSKDAVEARRKNVRRHLDASANDTPEAVLRESQRIERETPMALSAAFLRRYAALLAAAEAIHGEAVRLQEDAMTKSTETSATQHLYARAAGVKWASDTIRSAPSTPPVTPSTR